MKKTLLYSSILSMALVAMLPMQADDCAVPCRNPKTFLAHRSQSENAARNLCGVQRYINKCSRENVGGIDALDCCSPLDLSAHSYGEFSITPEYTQTFRGKYITEYFFGRAAVDGKVVFSGSKVLNRGPNDLLADYFGLPQDFRSTVCFNPRVQNFLVDFDLYIGLDKWARSAFFRITAPLVYTRWSMNAREQVSAEGDLPFPLGYMNVLEVPRASLPQGVLDTFGGNVTFGDLKVPLQYGKISKCPKVRSLTRLSDVQIALGWNFVNNDISHMGFAIRTALPAGNKPESEYLFEPIVGNGGHFELGLGFTSHLKFWECEDNNQSIALYFDCNVTHLFDTKQVRTFDYLDNGPLSRYILSAVFKDIVQNAEQENVLGSVSAVSAKSEYAGEIFNSINQITLCTNVNIQLQADVVFKLAYTYKNFEFDIGYNFWGRTQERLNIADEVAIELYGLKGDAFMYGAALPGAAANMGHMNWPPTAGTFDIAGSSSTVPSARNSYVNNAQYSRIPLSGMQEDRATAFSGGNYVRDVNGNFPVAPELNPGIDSPRSAVAYLNTNAQPNVEFVYSPIDGIGSDITPIRTSTPVDFGNDTEPFDLDVESAATPSVSTNKLFVNISYNWDRACRVKPFISLGGEVEFDAKPTDLGKHACDCRAAFNQWGVFLKGGIGF
ncbi:MAG: hypothetical protein NTX86_01940 [Candidatus Dependentiae bacterium]|nr:hypothetical protein [Candidatus Dependentiae bacterium]